MTEELDGGGGGASTRHRQLPRAAYRNLDDAALIDAMRRTDERAIDEFLVRHQRVLHDRVRQWRVALADVEDAISDVLEDVAVLIVNGRIRPSRSLAAYVTKALRVKLAERAKLESQRREFEYAAAVDTGGTGERAVAAAVSESTLRASRGVEWEPLPIPAVISRLATMLDRAMTEEERQILTWLSNFVAQRDICEWLGATYAAGTQRIWRLRERLRATAKQNADRFDASERIALDGFFRRMHQSGQPRPVSGMRRERGTQEAFDEGA